MINEPLTPSLAELLAELEETREALQHHMEQANYHTQQCHRLKQAEVQLLQYLPAVQEAETVARRVWAG